MDPSTKRILIILGVIIVVVIGLFILALAYTPPGGGKESGCGPERREALRKRFLGSQRVMARELQGCGSGQGKLVIPGAPAACELRIAASDARSRQLVLETSQVIEFKTTTDADGRKIEMKSELKTTEPTEISIGKDAQTITFSCCKVRNPPQNACVPLDAGLSCQAVLR
jgi:hypothetical protein